MPGKCHRPFDSPKQEAYLWANEPEVAKKKERANGNAPGFSAYMKKSRKKKAPKKAMAEELCSLADRLDRAGRTDLADGVTRVLVAMTGGPGVRTAEVAPDAIDEGRIPVKKSLPCGVCRDLYKQGIMDAPKSARFWVDKGGDSEAFVCEDHFRTGGPWVEFATLVPKEEALTETRKIDRPQQRMVDLFEPERSAPQELRPAATFNMSKFMKRGN
jgi:hypothetical protein